uniref:hypothetical protein n=1 Tax=Vibrio cholerae TaxID=666 RepID=UPI0011250ABE
EKTLITHIDDGFDFLGQNLRKYDGKMLIKPSKKNVKNLLRGIRNYLNSHKTPQTNGRHYTPKGCERKRLHHRVRDIKSVARYWPKVATI